VAGIHALRRRGRFVQVGVLAGADAHPEIPMPRVMFHELELIGSHGVPAARYERILELVGKGRLCPERLVARTIGLDEVPAALRSLYDAPWPGITVAVPLAVRASDSAPGCR
jgi:alcohol dehydrogenase